MTFTWAINTSTLPKHISEKQFSKEAKRAMDYISKASLNQVNFIKGYSNKNHIVFNFQDFGDSEDTGWWDQIDDNFLINFNTKYHWAATLWHYIIGNNQSLYMIIMHEVLHVVGMHRKFNSQDNNYHNPDPGSVMYSNPKYPHLTPNDVAVLRTITRKKYK